MCLAPELIKLGSDSTVTVGRWLTRSCAEVNSQHSTQTSIFHRNNDDCMGPWRDASSCALWVNINHLSRHFSDSWLLLHAFINIRETNGRTNRNDASLIGATKTEFLMPGFHHSTILLPFFRSVGAGENGNAGNVFPYTSGWRDQNVDWLSTYGRMAKMAQRQVETATAERQQNGGNQAQFTHSARC